METSQLNHLTLNCSCKNFTLIFRGEYDEHFFLGFIILTLSEMSCSYAEGLSEYHDKGKLGLPEKFDLEDEIKDKVETLTRWIREARHIVVHTGGS